MTTITYNRGQALPDKTFRWFDGAATPTLIPFASGYTFSVFVIRAGVTTQLAGSTVTGSNGDPNITVAFSLADLAALTADVDYRLEIRAQRISDGKPRDFPGPLILHIDNVP